MIHICNTHPMHTGKKFEGYLRKNTDSTMRQIAMRSDLNPSTFSRQLSGETRLTFDTIKAIHQGTGLQLLDLMVAADFLTEDEARHVTATAGLRGATDEEIGWEIIRRARGGNANMSRPVDNVTTGPWADHGETEVPRRAAARRNPKAKKEKDDDMGDV